MNSLQFRTTLSRFASGVTVMTGLDQAQKIGVTISAFSSLSLDPPMILFCLSLKSHADAAFKLKSPFAVHILHDRQKRISELFGRPGNRNWNSFDHHIHENGVPILDDVMAVLHCTVAQRYPGGDHTIITANVLDIALNDKRMRPLLHTQRRYHNLGRKKKPFKG